MAAKADGSWNRAVDHAPSEEQCTLKAQLARAGAGHSEDIQGQLARASAGHSV